tara:strand:- start:49 stop:390 length:342 start_codon:yes stop_codon:yes gene_type:complete
MATLKSLTGIEPKLKQEIVEVPELGEDAQIIVRELNARRMKNYREGMAKHPDFPVEHMIVACCIDDEGNQIAGHDDVLSISEMLPVEVSNRIFEACRSVNASIFESIDSKKKQ